MVQYRILSLVPLILYLMVLKMYLFLSKDSSYNFFIFFFIHFIYTAALPSTPSAVILIFRCLLLLQLPLFRIDGIEPKHDLTLIHNLTSEYNDYTNRYCLN